MVWMTNQILTAEKSQGIAVALAGFFNFIYINVMKSHTDTSLPLDSLCAACCLQFRFSGQKLTVTLTLGSHPGTFRSLVMAQATYFDGPLTCYPKI